MGNTVWADEKQRHFKMSEELLPAPNRHGDLEQRQKGLNTSLWACDATVSDRRGLFGIQWDRKYLATGLLCPGGVIPE